MNNTVYAYDSEGRLLIMNINDASYEIIKNLPEIGYGGQGIIINNQFHVIGGSQKRINKHHKWHDDWARVMLSLHDLKNVDGNQINRVGHHRLI